MAHPQCASAPAPRALQERLGAAATHAPGSSGAAELQGAFVDAGFGRQYAEAGALLRTASDGAAVAAASIHVVADRADTRFQAPSWPRAQRTEGDDSALLRPPTVLPR